MASRNDGAAARRESAFNPNVVEVGGDVTVSLADAIRLDSDARLYGSAFLERYLPDADAPEGVTHYRVSPWEVELP